MSKLRRLAVVGAALTLAVGAPERARGQMTTDNRSLFLAAVGGAAPEIFTGIFAFTRNAHSASWSRGIDRGDVFVPGMAYSDSRGGLLDDQRPSRGVLRAVNAYLLAFDPAALAFDNATSSLAALLSGHDDVRNVFLVFAQPGRGSIASQLGAGNASVPSFVNLPAQAAPMPMTGEVTLSDPPGPLAEVTATPEPTSLALMATGLIGIAGWTRRRKAKTAL